MQNLVYVHIGDNIPEYIYDSIYQTIIINGMSCKIYIIVNDNLKENIYKKIRDFNIGIYTNEDFVNICNVIPISILNYDNKIYIDYVNNLPKDITNFRQGFWINTTLRFFYIQSFMKTFGITSIFHIENDVMMYVSYKDILSKLTDYTKMYVVKDSETRVVPSIIYIPNVDCIDNYINYITEIFKNCNTFLNDMNLLGSYAHNKKTNEFPIFPKNDYNLLFDGASIGQYLGGIDSRNGESTKGFINETCIFKPNKYTFHRNRVYGYINNKYIKNFVCEDSKKITPIANLHIHSKQLYTFSSINDIQEEDIISGDRILTLCDFVLCTYDIYSFHKNIEKYNKNIIIIKDFKNVNFNILNDHFAKVNTKVIKLFIYTHILELFQEYILPHLNTTFKYVLYIHNSDHQIDNTYQKLINHNNIKHIYAQNINFDIHEKLTLLPIGLANSMWLHGDIKSLYKTITDTYKNKKQKNIYVNINPSTYYYRQNVLNEIEVNFEIQKQSLPYKDYLQELSKYRFCLCIRGNGLDTHRFWESLYLGVLPVIINNTYTNMNKYVEYLKKSNIPFYEIKKDSLSNYNSDMFNEELYIKILNECPTSLYNSDFLKLQHYKF